MLTRVSTEIARSISKGIAHYDIRAVDILPNNRTNVENAHVNIRNSVLRENMIHSILRV